MLFNEGDQGDAMYMLEQGHIDIYVKERQTGQEKHLRTFEAGDVVGEFSLLDGQPRSARAQARGPIRVLILQREVFYRFIQSRPDVVLAMLQYLADKVRFTTQSVETQHGLHDASSKRAITARCCRRWFLRNCRRPGARWKQWRCLLLPC